MTFKRRSQAAVEYIDLKFKKSNLGYGCRFESQLYIDRNFKVGMSEIVQGKSADWEGKTDKTKPTRIPAIKGINKNKTCYVG